MKKIIFAFSFLVSISVVCAQSVVRTMPNNTSKPSIIRAWHNQLSVIYAQDIVGQGCFLLEDHLSATILKASLPSDMTVTDMEVMNDTVFFCGFISPALERVRTVQGVVGLFDISGLFYSGYPIQIAFIRSADQMNKRSVATPSKIEPYHANGLTCMAFIGQYGEYDTLGGLLDGGPLWGTASYHGGWVNVDSRYTVGLGIQYTDVAVTDNCIAFSGNNGKDALLRVFDKSIILAGMDFISNEAYSFKDNSVSSPVLLENLGNDRLALANNYHENNSAQGLRLKIIDLRPAYHSYTLGPSLYIGQSRYSISNTWGLKDMHYLDSQHTLLLLQDMDFPSHPLVSTICRLNTAALGSAAQCVCLPGYCLESIDTCSISGFGYQAAGRENSSSYTATLFRQAMDPAGSCSFRESAGVLFDRPLESRIAIKDSSTSFGYAAVYPPITTETITTICLYN